MFEDIEDGLNAILADYRRKERAKRRQTLIKTIKVPYPDFHNMDEKIRRYLKYHPEIKYTRKISFNIIRYKFKKLEDSIHVWQDVCLLGREF